MSNQYFDNNENLSEDIPDEAVNEPAEEWVAEPRQNQFGYDTYRRPEGYDRRGEYMTNVGSSGNDLANAQEAAEARRAAARPAAAAAAAAASAQPA
ncbi:MAG: hypothetical protein IK116_05165, partial [Firmicutes bacterium]|nr:hypothetical protein [Bacillota bacterium]